MSDLVFVLGAGASRECGGPLMGDFLDVSESLLTSGGLGSDQEAKADFELVFKGVAELNAAFAKSVIDANNLEAVFAAFEMGQLFGVLGKLDAPQVARLPEAMARMIAKTLELSIRFRVGPDQRRLQPSNVYAAFVDVLSTILKEPQLGTLSVVTFNYDVALDFALQKANVKFDYGFDGRQAGQIDLLKLHGSVNWASCDKCGVVPWPMAEFLRKQPDYFGVSSGSTWPLGLLEHLPKCPRCKSADNERGVPFLVPPTWSKATYHQKIAAVWRQAARHLSEARNIVVVGYSLPETDQFFRYLYALGTSSSTRLRRFWVVDPDRSGQVEMRFRSLLGPLASQRFNMFKSEFGSMVGGIREEFVARARP